jgi:hypothetical protein
VRIETERRADAMLPHGLKMAQSTTLSFLREAAIAAATISWRLGLMCDFR